MRILEIRRHSVRVLPNQLLSAEGIALARRVGPQIGPFDRVVASPVTRAAETTAAMGFAIDEVREELGDVVRSPEAWASFEACSYPASFAQVCEKVRTEEVCASFAALQARVWREIVARLDDGQRALVVTHGHIVECGAIGLLPQAPYADWGGAIGYCEGVRLYFDGDECTGGEVLRIASS